ncbi:MAG: hypothetical protein P4M08_14995 [Oligoflexia bacterium]|nr:hypothetical protein [Oligoflexia bacterium]
MKKFVVLGIFALMASAVVANAAEGGRQDDAARLFRFDFSCDFPAGPPGSHSCKAYSTVFAYVDTHDWMNTMQSTRDPLNKFTVICDDRVVYSDSAILDPGHRRFVAITGLSGLPALLVERKDHQIISDKDMIYDADLDLDGGFRPIPGKCDVETRPVGL